MKFLYRYIASVIVFIILLNQSVFAVGLNRETLFSGITHSLNDSIFSYANKVWRVNTDKDITSADIRTKIFANDKTKRYVSVEFREKGKHQLRTNEMAVIEGKKYVYSDFIKTSVPTNVAVRITFDDNTTRRFLVGQLPGLAEWSEVNFTFMVPTSAVSYSVVHEIVG